MIKLANHDDTLTVVNLLKEFLKETSYKQALQAAEDWPHLCKIVWLALQHGYVWLALHDDLPAGVLIALKEPNVWVPTAREMREFVWYVKPEYRKTSLGGKLFLHYCQKGEELLSQGAIQGYFTTRMSTSDPIDYEGRGFRKTEETFLKE